MAPSRWADSEEDARYEEQRRREKDEKKRLKAKRAREAQQEEGEEKRRKKESEAAHEEEERARKRLKSQHDNGAAASVPIRRVLRHEPPVWGPSGSFDEYETLNPIEEGSYGWVSRARTKTTKEIVALKKLKMDGSEHSGFPVTGLREIQCLFSSHHENIVELKRVVVGNTLNEVYMVMEFFEHDLKTLMEDMREPFLASETKTLMIQLASAVEYLHDNWIIHILMNNRGTIKVADFGMARQFSSPPPAALTTLVVTLWYRAPELLLGTPAYDFSIDIWSIGCIFGELLMNEPLFPGKNEVDELSKIFESCGVPTEESWPDFRRLPNAKSLRLPSDRRSAGAVFRARFPTLTKSGVHLLRDLLELNPEQRPKASDIVQQPYFAEDPRPKSKAMFPTFPSKAGGERRRRIASPDAPRRGNAPGLGAGEVDFSTIFSAPENQQKGAGFQLRVG